MTIWRMRFACWIPRYTNTHSCYLMLFDFPLQQWLNERALMLLYMYTVLYRLEVMFTAAVRTESLNISRLFFVFKVCLRHFTVKVQVRS